MKNYYKILGIKPNSTAAEIESAYERLLDWQDKFPDTYTEQRRQGIDEAFDTLVDPIAREEYDRKFRQYEAQRREQQRQAAGRTKRHEPPPAPRKTVRPPPKAKKSWMRRRFASRIIIVMITLVISAIVGLIQDDSTGSDDQPTPFIFPTAGSPPPARKTTPTQPPPTRVVITSNPRPTIVLIGDRCNVRNASGQELLVYAVRDTQGEVVGQISTGATFFATRELGEWFSVSGDSLAQADDGYVHDSEIEVIFCQ